MHKELKRLKAPRNGFVMKNTSDDVEIRCTEKFVKFWLSMGFEIKEKKVIALID